MSNGNSSASVGGGGVGFCGLLTIVFIVLKILGHITWSWWWVLAPMWIPLAIGIGILAVILLFLGIGFVIKETVK